MTGAQSRDSKHTHPLLPECRRLRDQQSTHAMMAARMYPELVAKPSACVFLKRIRKEICDDAVQGNHLERWQSSVEQERHRYRKVIADNVYDAGASPCL